MDPMFLFLLSCLFLHHPLALPSNPTAHITVVGAVYCDVCYNNTFSTHSYFLPGVDVNVQCKFKEKSPRTTEQINLSVNRTSDRYGVYKLEIPSYVDCVEGPAIESSCKATLIGSTSSSSSSSSSECSVEGLKTTSDEITVKSRQEDNLCIYSLSALSYRPSKRNLTLCGNQIQEIPTYFNSSKFFLPYFPPYGLFWPRLPPPFPSFPLPPLPQLPPLPPLPFPFPPLPQTPPPPFNLGDPRTWIPNFPFPPAPMLPSPPPPRTWIPNFPILSPPPPPPSFNLGNPRTWIPFNPPTPPNNNPLKQDP